MRLIDANKLENRKFAGLVHGDAEENTYRLGWNDAIEAIMENEPTIEARPKGAWECGGFCFSTMSYCCPFCKSKTLERTKFCSECGADMRGGGNNDPN